MIVDNWPTVRCFVCGKVYSRHPDLPAVPEISRRCVQHRRTRLNAEQRTLDLFSGSERPLYGDPPPVPGAFMNQATGQWELPPSPAASEQRPRDSARLSTPGRSNGPGSLAEEDR